MERSRRRTNKAENKGRTCFGAGSKAASLEGQYWCNTSDHRKQQYPDREGRKPKKTTAEFVQEKLKAKDLPSKVNLVALQSVIEKNEMGLLLDV